MTKMDFLLAYEREVIARYDWATDKAKLERFMASVANTITGGVATWNHQGPAVSAAWHAIGGTGKVTLAALRSLST